MTAEDLEEMKRSIVARIDQAQTIEDLRRICRSVGNAGSTPARTAHNREIAALGGRARAGKTLSESHRANLQKRQGLPCNCGHPDLADPLQHLTRCRVYQREYQRRKRAKKDSETS